jgi:flagellar basal body-associated protein FliL
MKKAVALILIISLIVMVACAAHVHKVGVGAKKGISTQKRQWYALWGLAPLNQIDTREMAGDAKDYEIKTEASPVDIILNIFTSYITITSRTVTVTK